MSAPADGLRREVDRAVDRIIRSSDEFRYSVASRERGVAVRAEEGVVRAVGVPGVGFEELVQFEHGELGMVLTLDREGVGIVLLDPDDRIDAGTEIARTGRIMDVPVGERLLGRVLDGAGRPLDGGPRLDREQRRHVERRPPAIIDRAPVEVPLQTGITAVDALVPIGRGQRELIVGDRQTGKTTIAVDTIQHQRDGDVVSVYCAVGQQTASVAKVVAALRESGALDRTIVVVAGGEDPVGLRYVAPYAAMTMAEWFMDQGRDVLVVFDDLTRHARSYRELSLLLRRPPGREAYPGDIFYVHSRLLERASHLGERRGGGSLTALPIVETQAENLSAYIPTNLVSITDGQIYMSPQLFRRGQLPAIDVGRSVSRVGGQAQLAAYQDVSGTLRLAYSQFEELERFTRYGARLEERRRQQLERGRRVRRVLRQPPGEPRSVVGQIATLVAVTGGLFDDVPVDRIADVASGLVARADELSHLAEAVGHDRSVDDEAREEVERLVREVR